MTIVCLHHTILLTLVFFFQNTFGDIQRIYGALGGQVFIPASAHAHPEGDKLECRFTREGGKKTDSIMLCNLKANGCGYLPEARYKLLFDNFVILLQDLRREDSGIYSCIISENSSNLINISSNLQVLDNISESLTMKNRTENKNVTEFNETSPVMKKWVYGLSISNLTLVVCSIAIISFAYKATGIRMRWLKRTFFNLYLTTTELTIVAEIVKLSIWIQAGGPVPALCVAIVAFAIGFVLVPLSLFPCSFINNALFLSIINASPHFMIIVIFFTSIIGIATMATDTSMTGQDCKDVYLGLLIPGSAVVILLVLVCWGYYGRKPTQSFQSAHQENGKDGVPLNDTTGVASSIVHHAPATGAPDKPLHHVLEATSLLPSEKPMSNTLTGTTVANTTPVDITKAKEHTAGGIAVIVNGDEHPPAVPEADTVGFL